MSPAPPIPEIARPRINASDDGAAPETTDPTSKMSKAAKNTHFMAYSAYSLPKKSWKHVMVIRYEEPYQPMSSRELNSEVILGTAVATMARSLWHHSLGLVPSEETFREEIIPELYIEL